MDGFSETNLSVYKFDYILNEIGGLRTKFLPSLILFNKNYENPV